MADAQLPDGNIARIPDFALEKTQEDMKKILEAMMGSDKKSLALYKALIDEVKENGDGAEDIAKQAQQLQKDQIKATEGVAGAVKNAGGIAGGFMSGVKKLDGWMTTAFMGIGTAALAGAGLLARSVSNIGNSLLELQQVGVGFTDVTGSAEGLIADLNYLGLSSKQAAALMASSAGVIQTLGKSGFSDIQKTFSQLSDNGSRFGLSLAETAEVLAEDLETRQQLGILGRIDQQKQAQRSAELYDSQMKAVQLLGKSIDELRKSGEEFIANNADVQLGLMEVAANLGPEAAAKLTFQTEKLAGDLAAMGIDPNVANQMMKEMFNVQAFMGEGGKELYKTLSTVGGQGGKELADTIQSIQKGLRSGDPKQVEAAQQQMAEFPTLFGNMAQSLKGNGPALAQLRNMLGNLGPMGEALSKSLGPAATAMDNMGKTGDSTQSGLAKAAQAYSAAMDTASGAVSGALTDATGAFAAPLGAFAEALTQSTYTLNGERISREAYMALSEEEKKQVQVNMSIMDAFRQAVDSIRVTIMDSFGLAADDVGGLAEKIRAWLVPAITGFGEWFSGGGFAMVKGAFGFLGDVLGGIFTVFTSIVSVATSLYNGFNSLIDGITFVYDSFIGAFGPGGIYEPVGNAFSYLGDKIGIVTGAIGKFYESIFGPSDEEAKKAGEESSLSLGKVIGVAIGGIFAFSKAIKIATATAALFGKAKGMLGMGKSAVETVTGGAGNVASQAGGGMASAGKAIGNFGKGVGKGIGGIFTGLANGIKAFANPMVIAGAAGFGAAIALIGAGIAGATWIVGKALPTFAEGMQSFQDLDGAKLVDVATGIAAIGAAMAVMGGGGAVGAVGGAVTGIIEGIGSFFGADKPIDKLKEFASYDIDVAGVVYNAKAFTAFGEAMTAFGAGTGVGAIGSMVDGLASFMGADPVSMINKFADAQINVAGIDANIAALDKLEILFAKYAALEVPGQMIEGKQEAIAGLEMDSVSKSALAASSPAAYSAAVSRAKTETLRQPEVMGIEREGRPMIPTVDTQAFIPDNATNELVNEFKTEAANNASMASSDPQVVAILAQIAGQSAQQTKILKKLNGNVQDSF